MPDSGGDDLQAASSRSAIPRGANQRPGRHLPRTATTSSPSLSDCLARDIAPALFRVSNSLIHAGRTMRNQLSLFRADDDTDYTTDIRHVITRGDHSIGRCLSVVLAAYEAANRYQQLAKVSRAELERRGKFKPGRAAWRTQEGHANKVSTEIREAARRYGREALQLHVKLMRASKNEDVRQRSANVILDRAYGRPSQVASDDEENPLQLLMDHLDGKTRGLPSEQ